MKKILVPFDFSPASANAYRLALSIARQAKGSVRLLHVVEFPSMPNTVLAPVRQMEEKLLNEFNSKLAPKINAILKANPAKGVKTTVSIEIGSVTSRTLEHAARHDCDLIIIGTHGRSAVREPILGTNAGKILRLSTVPVIIVKGPSTGKIRNIVFATDLQTDDAADVVSKIKQLQRLLKAKLHVVYVNTPAHFETDVASLSKLEKFARRFKLSNCTFDVFNHNSLGEGVVEFAAWKKAELVVMATHRRTGLAHILTGNKAEEVLNRITFPIWTCVVKQKIKSK